MMMGFLPKFSLVKKLSWVFFSLLKPFSIFLDKVAREYEARMDEIQRQLKLDKRASELFKTSLARVKEEMDKETDPGKKADLREKMEKQEKKLEEILKDTASLEIVRDLVKKNMVASYKVIIDEYLELKRLSPDD